MLNFNQFSAILGLVALGAMTSCSVKENVSGCPEQQVISSPPSPYINEKAPVHRRGL